MKRNSIVLFFLFVMITVFAVFIISCHKPNDIIPELSIPELTTSDVSNIGLYEASCGGKVTSDGGLSVTVRGVCWSTSTSFTIDNCLNKTTDGSGSGSFTSNITGMNPNLAYYVRAYATNSLGTGYGEMKSFTSLTLPPNVSTNNIQATNAVSVVAGGNISDDYGTAVIARGICWGTNHNPAITGNKTVEGSGTGSFTSNISDLSPNTTYYVRAYGTSGAGTSYGNEVNFTTKNGIIILSTIAASSITTSTTLSGGDITNDGGETITARGVCYSTSPNPTIANSKTVDGSGTGGFVSSMSQLALGTAYYARAYATNIVGTVYGNEVDFVTVTRYIGESFQGGVVAYVLQPGDPGFIKGQTKGLITAPSDQSAGIQWYNGSFTTTNATSTVLGTGNANTNNIVAAQGAGTYAAKTCYDLDLGGYSDWYLPSKDELNKLFINRATIGGFTNNSYWSSTENSSNNAWWQCFDSSGWVCGPNGSQWSADKSATFYVRAVRTF